MHIHLTEVDKMEMIRITRLTVMANAQPAASAPARSARPALALGTVPTAPRVYRVALELQFVHDSYIVRSTIECTRDGLGLTEIWAS